MANKTAKTVQLDPAAYAVCLGCGANPGIRCDSECEFYDNRRVYEMREVDPHAPECVECGTVAGVRCSITCPLYRFGPMTAWVTSLPRTDRGEWPPYEPGDPAGRLNVVGYGRASVAGR